MPAFDINCNEYSSIMRRRFDPVGFPDTWCVYTGCVCFACVCVSACAAGSWSGRVRLLMAPGSQSPSVPPRHATLHRGQAEVGAGVFQGDSGRSGCVTCWAVAPRTARCFSNLILSMLSIFQLRGWPPTATLRPPADWNNLDGAVDQGGHSTRTVVFVCLCVYVFACADVCSVLGENNRIIHFFIQSWSVCNVYESSPPSETFRIKVNKVKKVLGSLWLAVGLCDAK